MSAAVGDGSRTSVVDDSNESEPYGSELVVVPASSDFCTSPSALHVLTGAHVSPDVPSHFTVSHDSEAVGGDVNFLASMGASTPLNPKLMRGPVRGLISLGRTEGGAMLPKNHWYSAVSLVSSIKYRMRSCANVKSRRK